MSRRLTPYNANINPLPKAKSSSKYFDPPIYIDLIKEQLDSGTIFYHDEIYLSFNAQRLFDEGVDLNTLKSILDSLQIHDSSLRELRSKLSDEQLMSTIKSKHIQTSSELSSWSNYLNNLYTSSYNSGIIEDTSSISDSSTEPSE